MAQGSLDSVLLGALEHEIALLRQFGFAYSDVGGDNGYRFDRTVPATVCAARLRRDRQEAADAEVQQVDRLCPLMTDRGAALPAALYGICRPS